MDTDDHDSSGTALHRRNLFLMAGVGGLAAAAVAAGPASADSLVQSAAQPAPMPPPAENTSDNPPVAGAGCKRGERAACRINRMQLRLHPDAALARELDGDATCLATGCALSKHRVAPG